MTATEEIKLLRAALRELIDAQAAYHVACDEERAASFRGRGAWQLADDTLQPARRRYTTALVAAEKLAS